MTPHESAGVGDDLEWHWVALETVALTVEAWFESDG
jgi:hypothetical protein